MYHATDDRRQLDRFARVMRAYYATKEGAHFHPIGIPVTDGLKALEQAGRNAERAELLGKIREHADNFIKRGTDYPLGQTHLKKIAYFPLTNLK